MKSRLQQTARALFAGVACCCAAARASATEGTESAIRTTRLDGSVAFGVTAGQFGADPLYSFQLAYFPSHRFGLEATLAHNPASGTHAALHHVSGIVPFALWHRFRPFAVAGLGTIQVFPGTAVNAKSVTKLLLQAGLGTHVHLRRDVALRLEGRAAGLVDHQEDQAGILGYAQWSVGVTFLRGLNAPQSMDTGDGP
ncbi:MAG: hypothetical protein JSW67_05275 [Candidatus Latescibacterota bacterium]|nr:MAG: hypothetical protein JSW67_05275 [Candidatus Latescibacterota bacterium]